MTINRKVSAQPPVRPVSLPGIRFHGLDFLRAVAILSVIYSHGPFMSSIIPEAPWDGVSIFFALSGFLIGRILFTEISTPRFYINRWFRTLPLYYLVLFFLLLTYVNISQWSPKFLFFLQSFPTSDSPFFRETWSLTIEEWTYLFLPLMLRKWKLPATILTLISVPLVFRAFCIDNSSVAKTALLSRVDAIPWGVLAAFAYTKFPGHFRKLRFVALTGAVCLFFVNTWAGNNQWYGRLFYYSVEPIAYAMILPFFVHFTVKIPLASYVARISYSLYLTHWCVTKYLIVDRVMKAYPLMPRPLLYWFLVFAVGHLVSKYVEYPIMSLRKRIPVSWERFRSRSVQRTAD